MNEAPRVNDKIIMLASVAIRRATGPDVLDKRPEVSRAKTAVPGPRMQVPRTEVHGRGFPTTPTGLRHGFPCPW